MSDPMKPLLHGDGTELERTLLRAGLDLETPPEGARGRALAALGLVAPSTGDTSPASAPATSGVLAHKWIVLAAVAVAGSAVIAASSWQESAAPEARAAAAEPAPAVTSGEAPAPPSTEHAFSPAEPPTISPHALPNAPAPKASATNVRRPIAGDEAPRALVTDDALARETSLIDDARRAIAAGEPARALALLDVHDREFTVGAFQLDAGVLRIEALERAGRGAEAARLAHDFLGRHPAGTYARRARAALDRIEGAKREPAGRPQ